MAKEYKARTSAQTQMQAETQSKLERMTEKMRRAKKKMHIAEANAIHKKKILREKAFLQFRSATVSQSPSLKRPSKRKSRQRRRYRRAGLPSRTHHRDPRTITTKASKSLSGKGRLVLNHKR